MSGFQRISDVDNDEMDLLVVSCLAGYLEVQQTSAFNGSYWFRAVLSDVDRCCTLLVDRAQLVAIRDMLNTVLEEK